MSQPKVDVTQFIDFIIATPLQATATEAQRTQPESVDPPAHDAYNRLLHRLEPTSEALWLEVQPDVRRTSGVLVLDDTVLDKPYARKMDLVHHMWSGKHHRVVKGIDLLTLLWTDGDRHLPCDYRIYDKPNDQKTKNDHFGDLLQVARDRGFAPECVLFRWLVQQSGEPETTSNDRLALADTLEVEPSGEPGSDGSASGECV